jgi:hypothetical protein
LANSSATISESAFTVKCEVVLELKRILTHLAVQGKVAASTQNQAKAALLFLYREVLEIELPWLDNVEQAKVPKRLPAVLNRDEIQGNESEFRTLQTVYPIPSACLSKRS